MPRVSKYPGLVKLAKAVRANCLEGGTTSKEVFLPNDKLEKLVTKESVLLALQEITTKENHEELATWVLESGKRVFLILVLLTRKSSEELSWLEDFKNDNINDGALPLSFPVREPYYGYSRGMGGEQKFHLFERWEDNNLSLFTEYQWMFLAPVFGAHANFRHQLYQKQPLPLLNVVEEPGRSIIGKILHGEIHPAHIDPRYLWTLGINHDGSQGIPVFIKIIQPSDKIHRIFDLDTGEFKAAHPNISPSRIRPIASYTKDGNNFVIFRWADGGGIHN